MKRSLLISVKTIRVIKQVLWCLLRFLLLFAAARSNAIVAFYERGDLARTRLLGHVTRFKMAENICTIFSHSNLSVFVQKKKKEDKWVHRTFTKHKRKFFMEVVLSSKISRKCNIFSIVIVNLWDSNWMIDERWLKWCRKLGKHFFLI